MTKANTWTHTLPATNTTTEQTSALHERVGKLQKRLTGCVSTEEKRENSLQLSGDTHGGKVTILSRKLTGQAILDKNCSYKQNRLS